MRRLIATFPLLHGIPLLAYLLTRHLLAPDVPEAVPERAWWSIYNLVSMLNEFTPFFFLPLPLWLLTAASGRSRGALLCAALPWALFLWLYGALFLPRPSHLALLVPPPGAAQPTLRVMTFNLLAVPRPAAALAEVVRRADPDVLLVQELNAALAQSLDQALVATYPHRRLRPATGALGAGLWSRYSITDEEAWPGSRRNARWQHATLDVGGTTVHLVNLHLTTPALRWSASEDWPFPLVTGEVTQGRNNEVLDLLPRLRPLAAGPQPLIVAGDLNLTDQTQEYRTLLSAGLADAHRSAGWGFGHTFPSTPSVTMFRRRIPIPTPLLRLDYVLVSPRLRVRRVTHLPESGGSDHFPVLADLVVS